MGSSSLPPPIVSSSQPPPPPGWWTRNWKWALPMGCLSVLLLFFIFIASIVALVMGSFRNSEVYKEALARARSNPEVVQKLGTPIHAGWLISGSVNVDGASGKADLNIPISGPKGKGTIYLDAVKFADEWKFRRLAVGIEGQTQRVNLLTEEPQ